MAGVFKFGLNKGPAPELKFGDYLVPHNLPAIPQSFNRSNLIKFWLPLSNFTIGDCTVAGAMHAIMLWNKLGGKPIPWFTDQDAKDDYFTITGGQDTGANIVDVADYWRKTGFRDSKVTRHQIAAYMAGDPGNPEHVDIGCYLFGVAGWGIEVPKNAVEQFRAGVPWAPVSNDPIEGYHFVPQIDRLPNGNSLIVTWGATQEVTPAWRKQYLQEVCYYISQEEMENGKTPEGFDMSALQDDLSSVTGA